MNLNELAFSYFCTCIYHSAIVDCFIRAFWVSFKEMLCMNYCCRFNTSAELDSVPLNW